MREVCCFWRSSLHFATVRPAGLCGAIRVDADWFLSRCCPQGFQKSFRRLRARKRNGFVDDIERHARNAEHPCPLFFFAHGGRTFFAGEEAFQLRSVHACGRPDFNQLLRIAEVDPFAKVSAEQSLDHGVLHAGSSRQPNEPVRSRRCWACAFANRSGTQCRRFFRRR